ncbi:hypothetical protein ACJ41O_001076 [Fusarium nematophilum]
MASTGSTDAESDPKVAVGHSLTGPHLDAFKRAIWNIISTDIAEETYAQLIDGLPLAEVVQDDANADLPNEHPAHDHEEFCPGVLEKTREFRDSFDPELLSIDASLLADYRASSPGSRAFNIQLIELAALSVHEIAVQLYQMESMYHSDGNVVSWRPPESYYIEYFTSASNYEKAWPTLFRHAWYLDHQEYPHGLADVAGFWAESRIFGGVVLFDRRDPDEFPDEAQPDSVWLHPSREEGTYRIVRLLDNQRQALLEFLTSKSPSLSLLPILVDKRNVTREDPEEPIALTGIYRHIWERKPMPRSKSDFRMKDVWDQVDYPARSDWDRARGRAFERDHLRYRPGNAQLFGSAEVDFSS